MPYRQSAKRNDILGAINDYRKTLKANDNLLVYYVGHGEFDIGISDPESITYCYDWKELKSPKTFVL
jgi:hypothetical protein